MADVFTWETVLVEWLPLAAIPAVISVIVAYVALYLGSDLPKHPPRVDRIPLVGNRLALRNKPLYIAFQNLSKKYGHVFSMRLGKEYTVVCGSSKSIKELYSKPELLARPSRTFMKIFPDGGGLYDFSGKEWIEHRNFTLRAIREVGHDNAHIQELFKEEIREFMDHLKTTDREPVLIRSLLILTMHNIMSIILLRQRFNYSEPMAQFFLQLSSAVENIRESHDLVDYIPGLRTLLAHVKPDRQLKKRDSLLRKWNNFFRLQIEEHRREFDNRHLKDFIDHYLAVMEENNDKDTSFTDKALRGSLQVLMLTGTLDLEAVLFWCFLAMASYPRVQEEVQQEIEDVIGRNKPPVVEDYSKMLYTRAVLNEVHRWRVIAPLGCPRYALKDTSIGDYFIPKKTVLIPNLWAVHHDPMYWKNPDKFQPERHLSSDRQTLVLSEDYMPFGLGKRQSPGKKFAEIQIFLYLTSVLQRFTIKMPPGTKACLEGSLGISLHPQDQKICFIPREF